MAEAYLEDQEGVVFPWNAKRDFRNPNASLPGADIVGIVGEDSESIFAFGECKKSWQKKYPPNVMTNKDGMRKQLSSLVNEHKKRSALIKWLFYRTVNTPFGDKYTAASKNYYHSRNINYVLYGVLIRDTKPVPNDLSGTGIKINAILALPTRCKLKALYLPWGLNDLVPKIAKHGSKK